MSSPSAVGKTFDNVTKEVTMNRALAVVGLVIGAYVLWKVFTVLRSTAQGIETITDAASEVGGAVVDTALVVARPVGNAIYDSLLAMGYSPVPDFAPMLLTRWDLTRLLSMHPLATYRQIGPYKHLPGTDDEAAPYIQIIDSNGRLLPLGEEIVNAINSAGYDWNYELHTH